MPKRHHKPKHACSAKREWGANEFEEYVPERQQELELVFGQIGVEGHKPQCLLLMIEHKQSVFGSIKSARMCGHVTRALTSLAS
jgi:hypothetical protein